MGVVNGKSMKSMMNTEVLLFSNKHVYLETHTKMAIRFGEGNLCAISIQGGGKTHYM